MISRCDEAYWKYANMKVDAVEKNKSTHSESFHVLLRTIERLQDELAVALAHLRSLSVCVIEGVVEWKVANKRNTMTEESVSLYWKKSNYLIKMLTDCTELLNVPIMWMWLGFEPDVFMLPPKEQNVTTSWMTREALYQDWLVKHRNHQQQALDNIKKLTRAAVGTRPTYVEAQKLQEAAGLGAVLPQGGTFANSGNLNGSSPSDTSPASQEGDGSHVQTPDTSNVVGDHPDMGKSFVVMNNRKTRVQHASSSGDGLADSDLDATGFSPKQSESTIATKLVISLPEEKCENSIPASNRNQSPSVRLNLDRSHVPTSASLSSGTLLAPKTVPKSSTLVALLEEDRAADNEPDTGNEEADVVDGPTEEEKDAASETDSDDSSSAQSAEEWRSLRKVCLDSWICMGNSPSRKPVMSGKDPFWDNVDLSSVVVQAAVGFTETMPKKLLIPQVNQSVIILCEHLLVEIHKEVKLEESLKGLRVERQRMKKQLLTALENQGIERALQQSKSWHVFEAQNLLRFRQQYCPPLSTSSSANALPAEHPLGEAGDLPRGFSRSGERSSSPLPRSAGRSTPTKRFDDHFEVFLTSERDDGLKGTPKPMTATRIAIDKDKTIAKSEGKVEADRILTERVKDSVVLVKSRRSKRAMVERMRVTPAVVLIQAVARGYITRKILARKKSSMRIFFAALLIQRCVRKLLAKYRADRLKIVFRRDAFIARREILKKNKCAFIVTKFMRWAAFMVLRTKLSLQVSTITSESVKQKVTQFARGSVVLQSVWRGHLARKKATRVLEALVAQRADSTDVSVHSTKSERQYSAMFTSKKGSFAAGSRTLSRASSSSSFQRLPSNIKAEHKKLKKKPSTISETTATSQALSSTLSSSDCFNMEPEVTSVKKCHNSTVIPESKSGEIFNSFMIDDGGKGEAESLLPQKEVEPLEIIIPNVPNALRMRAIRPTTSITAPPSVFTDGTTINPASHSLYPKLTSFSPESLRNKHSSSKYIGSHHKKTGKLSASASNTNFEQEIMLDPALSGLLRSSLQLK